MSALFGTEVEACGGAGGCIVWAYCGGCIGMSRGVGAVVVGGRLSGVVGGVRSGCDVVGGAVL